MPEYRFPVYPVQTLAEIPADEPRRDGFQIVDQLAQLDRGICPKKQLDVIFFPVEFHQLGIPLLKRLLKNRVESFKHFPGDRFAAIFSD